MWDSADKGVTNTVDVQKSSMVDKIFLSFSTAGRRNRKQIAPPISELGGKGPPMLDNDKKSREV